MIQIIGWLTIILSCLLLAYGLIGMLGMFGSFFSGNLQIWITTGGPGSVIFLIFGIIMIYWASSLRKYKKWTWYFGMILYGAGLPFEFFSFFISKFDFANLLGFLYALFVVMALVLNKGKFLTKVTPVITPEQATPEPLPVPAAQVPPIPQQTPVVPSNSQIPGPVNPLPPLPTTAESISTTTEKDTGSV